MIYRTSLVAPAFGLRREIDRLFEGAFGGQTGVPRTPLLAPVTDVKEGDEELTLTVELPVYRLGGVTAPSSAPGAQRDLPLSQLTTMTAAMRSTRIADRTAVQWYTNRSPTTSDSLRPDA